MGYRVVLRPSSSPHGLYNMRTSFDGKVSLLNNPYIDRHWYATKVPKFSFSPKKVASKRQRP